jgi:pilus assembly protein CpaB
MHKNRLLIVLLLALSSGLLAGYLALNYLAGASSPGVETEVRSRARLAVAARDLPTGTVLRGEDIRLIDWPADVLPLGYSGTTAELVGRGLMGPVRANEPLLSSKLADREAGGGLPILIQEGMRAVSVKVDEVIGVAGFVTPGTRVDVLVTLSRGAERDNATSRVILQNVQTLAAGQAVERDIEGKPQTVTVITLLVSPEDSEKLTLGATEGRIQLALRGALDMAETRTPGARLTTLVESPRAVTGPTRAVQVNGNVPRERQGTVVEMYRGGVRTLNTF